MPEPDPWARSRRIKGGLKVHVLLDHDDYMPAFTVICDALKHDVKVARSLRLNPGAIVAKDCVYNDYQVFAAWTERDVSFVTRMKDNAVYEVLEQRHVPLNRNILSDEIIRLTGMKASERCPHMLRRVVVWDSENDRENVPLANYLKFGATTIANDSKHHWQIELFFKALKRNLKNKAFVATTENALRIQIWTALLALHLLKRLHYFSSASWPFSSLAPLLHINLRDY